MADQVTVESAGRDDGKDRNTWYPLRKWWRPYWLFNQDFGLPLIPDPGELWWRTDLFQGGLSSGRPWPECTSSPLIVPLHAGSRYARPPGPGVEQVEQYKWRVVLDVAHFSPSEISISTADDALEIRGKHKERSDEHGFIARAFTRKYRLPIGIDLSKITSILSGDGILYVEAPLTQFTAPAPVVIPIQVERDVPQLRQGEEYLEDSAEPPREGTDHGSTDPEPPREVTDHGSTDPEPPREVTDHGSTDPEPPREGTDHGSTDPEPPREVTDHGSTDPEPPREVTDHGSTDPEPPREVTDHGSTDPEPPREVTDHGSTDPEPPREGTDHGSTDPEPPREVTDHGDASEPGVEAHAGREQEEPEKEEEARGEVESIAAGVGEGPENLPEPIEYHEAPEESPESPENPGAAPSDHQEEEAGTAPLEPAESPEEVAVEVTQAEEPKEGESPANQDITSQE